MRLQVGKRGKANAKTGRRYRTPSAVAPKAASHPKDRDFESFPKSFHTLSFYPQTIQTERLIGLCPRTLEYEAALLCGDQASEKSKQQ